MPSYEFRLFISYSSEDRVWAERLHKDLTAAGVADIFFDQDRLQPGRPWEPQLAANVPKSQHLVVLWTKAGRLSDWVREETIRFKTEIDPKGTGPLNPDRELFQILAQTEQSPTLTRYHAFTSLKDVDVASGPDAMTEKQAAAWAAIVFDIAEAANPPGPETPWPAAVFATTSAMLAATPASPPEGTLDEFLQTIGISNAAAFEARYTTRPEDWKPFGSHERIATILDGVLEDVNTSLTTADPNAARLRWRYVDLITTPFSRLDDEVQKLSTGPCLLIIDPLSLLVQRISQRFGHLSPCFENKHATILWLTPFAPHLPLVILRELVRGSAQPLIRGYYEPVPPRPPLGRCTLNVVDSAEISRQMLLAVAEMSTLTATSVVSPVLSLGERRRP